MGPDKIGAALGNGQTIRTAKRPPSSECGKSAVLITKGYKVPDFIKPKEKFQMSFIAM